MDPANQLIIEEVTVPEKPSKLPKDPVERQQFLTELYHDDPEALHSLLLEEGYSNYGANNISKAIMMEDLIETERARKNGTLGQKVMNEHLRLLKKYKGRFAAAVAIPILFLAALVIVYLRYVK